MGQKMKDVSRDKGFLEGLQLYRKESQEWMRQIILTGINERSKIRAIAIA